MCENEFPTATENESFKYLEEKNSRTKNLGGGRFDPPPLGQRRVNPHAVNGLRTTCAVINGGGEVKYPQTT